MDVFSRYWQAPLYRWMSLRSELLWIWDGPVAKESLRVFSDHSVGYWVWLIRRGKVRVEMRGRSWEASAGQWLIAPQGPSQQEFSNNARILSVHFRSQWPTGENLFSDNKAEILLAKKFPRMERSAIVLKRLVHRHFPSVRIDLTEKEIDYSVFLRFQQRFQQWLIEFKDAMTASGRTLAHAGGGDERILRAARFMHNSPLNSPFPADLLQRETGLGRTQLDRLYWQEFGVTTREYWERLRQEVATRNLESSILSIKEIGYELGFKQPSHFTKWFIARTGKTPTAYREESPSLRA